MLGRVILRAISGKQMIPILGLQKRGELSVLIDEHEQQVRMALNGSSQFRQRAAEWENFGDVESKGRRTTQRWA